MIINRRIAMIRKTAVAVLLLSVLSGCSNNDAVAPTATNTSTPTADPTATPPFIATLDSEQRNSINMLNYLAVLTQEIYASSNSRIYLESAYSSLLNNTYPNAVDDRTLGQLESILDTLKKYRMLTEKRDRLEFIYEQNQAQAVRRAIPNPLGLISAVQSSNLGKLVASVAYMAVDSFSSYQDASTEASLQHLQDGWTQDDQASDILHTQRTDTFRYLVDTVNDYNLPGDLSLNEEAVNQFVEYKNKDNVARRLQFLESHQSIYHAYGGYWLLLSKSYYEHQEYAKCIESLRTYESLKVEIFRRDHDYAKIIPLAITAAREVCENDEYVQFAEEYVGKLLKNCDDTDWALRYFATQTYIDLYSKTADIEFLQSAYNVTLDTINNTLLDKQAQLNATYLTALSELEKDTPKEATKAEKEEITNYNKLLKEERKKELPPVYEPLLINCELLFSLATELDLPEAERVKIDDILHHPDKPLFLVTPLDNAFWMNDPDAHSIDASHINIEFDGTRITIPAEYVSSDASMIATIAADSTITVTDWTLEKVDRNKSSNIADFTAIYSSKEIEGKIAPGAEISIEITSKNDSSAMPLSFKFKAVDKERWAFLPDGMQLQRVQE